MRPAGASRTLRETGTRWTNVHAARCKSPRSNRSDRAGPARAFCTRMQSGSFHALSTMGQLEGPPRMTLTGWTPDQYRTSITPRFISGAVHLLFTQLCRLRGPAVVSWWMLAVPHHWDRGTCRKRSKRSDQQQHWQQQPVQVVLTDGTSYYQRDRTR